jgi:GTP-binding protein
MFENPKFIKSVYKLSDLPKIELPVVILCGRSNVGKSSFINSLANQKNLAKTSSTPGKTRSINYYLIDNRFFFVDLPGFGYAKTNKAEREHWSKLITDFISNTKNITLAFHLIDSRHQATDLDINLNNLLKKVNIPFLIILTKADKLTQQEKSISKKRITETFPEVRYGESFIFYSSLKKTGRKDILSLLNCLFNK